MKKLLYISLFLTQTLFAQSPFFKTHQLGEAHRNAKVELLFEAQNSLLWFGTSQGLFSYDGFEFIPFFKTDSSSNHVRAIYQDASEKLWIGYQDGSIFYLEKQYLEEWQPEEGLPKVPITGFSEDAAGRFWIATYGEGLYFKNGRRLYNINAEDGLLGDDIYVLKKDRNGRMWAGTDGGISICSYENDSKKIKNLTRADGLPDEIIREIISDEKGNFWIGTYDGGVCFYDFEKQKFTQPIADWDKGIVSNLELFEGRELWIGTEGEGLWKYSLLNGSLQIQSEQNNLSDSKIYDLHKDTEGNIWVISNTHGICHANRQFEWVKTDFENTQTILADSENQIWIGTQKGIFSYELNFETGESSFKKHLPNFDLNVISLFEDRFGNLWIGTFGEGILIFNKKTKKTRRLTEKDGLNNGSILSMAGKNRNVWLATLGGVTEIDLKENLLNGGKLHRRDFTQENGLGTNFIYNVFIDSKGRTWFATDGKGITVLENGRFKNYDSAAHVSEGQTTEKNISLKTIYSIAEDNRGHIWFSTAKAGIFEFTGNSFKHLNLKEGIRDLPISGLVTDTKGNILIIHPTGLDILTPENHHLIYYDDEVGINNIDPYLNAFCTDREGNIWIGAKNGIVKYIPLNEDLEIHPRTRINSVSIFSESIDFQLKNCFSHNENYFVFDYFGLWYTDPATVKYRYQLEGFDRDWIFSKDRKVTYSHLPPGKYTFNVTSTENDAWIDEPIISYSFEIFSPFWQRWWFLIGCVLTGGGLFFWYQKSRDERLQRVNLLQKEKIESQLETLKSQINPHFLFNSFNTLSAIIEENPNDAVEYVEKLSDFYRSIIQHRDKEVISLEEEIELIENFSFLLKKRFSDNFNLQIKAKSRSFYIVPLTLQMLVENAVKHNIVSKSKPLNIIVSIDQNEEYISVKNNLQKKFSPAKSTHFGLQSIEKRYALLNEKKVKIEETEAFFEVKIPLIRLDN